MIVEKKICFGLNSKYVLYIYWNPFLKIITPPPPRSTQKQQNLNAQNYVLLVIFPLDLFTLSGH